MLRRPLGHLSLIAVAAPLAVGALVAVGARHLLLTPRAADIVDWVYLFASPALALAAVTVLHVTWWRRRWTFAEPSSRARPPEWEWLLVTAGCAFGLGFYAGALHHLSLGMNLSAVIAYFVLLPVTVVSAGFGYAPGRALLRLGVLMGCLELCCQISHALTQHGRLRYWDDITWANAWFLLGGGVVTLCGLWPFQHRLRVAAERLRAAPRARPEDEPPPRRAARRD